MSLFFEVICEDAPERNMPILGSQLTVGCNLPAVSACTRDSMLEPFLTFSLLYLSFSYKFIFEKKVFFEKILSYLFFFII